MQSSAYSVPITSKVLVNGGFNKVVNIASTKMMKKFFESSRADAENRPSQLLRSKANGPRLARPARCSKTIA